MSIEPTGIISPPPLNLETTEEEKKIDKPSKGKTLDEIFDQNSNDKSFQSQGTQSIGYLQRLIHFFNSFKREETNEVSLTSEKKKEHSAINFIPSIDEPDHFDPRLMNLRLLKSTEPSSTLTTGQVFEGLSLMSDTTAHQVMMIVLGAQQELARDGALLNLDDLEKFQKIQKLQHQVLKDVKIALQQDEKISGYFKTAQWISIAAGGLTTLASVIGWFVGFEIPYDQVIQIASALSTGLATAGKSYFDIRADDDKAKFIDVDHQTKVRKGYIESTSDRIERCSQTDLDRLCSKLLKDMIELSKMINS